MSHDHSSGGGKHARRLGFALVLTAAYTAVEATVGFVTGSLVLVADAGHMLTDVAGLTFALGAIWFAQRPASAAKTYGYYRIEILAALVNGLLLFGVAAYILFEAYGRLESPPDVPSGPLLIVASIGLLVNLVSAAILFGGAGESLNVKGAFLEVASDILGSVGAIAAGIILLTTGWRYADPLFAAAVGLFILPRTWRLMRESVDILLEGTPRNIAVDAVTDAILKVDGVSSVHDLHVWTVTSGFVALSGHVGVRDGADRDAMLVSLRESLAAGFHIEHVTLQMETPVLEEALGQSCFPGQSVCYASEPQTQSTRGDQLVS
jgi:cobalt-zinc-cadmium efflux system protein